MTQQRASSVARDERAERRAAQTGAETAAARETEAALAAREAAKRVQVVMAGHDGDAVATSANVRVASGRTPRTGDDGDDGDGAVFVGTSTGGGSGSGGGDGGRAPPAPARPTLEQHEASAGGASTGSSTGAAPPVPPTPPAPMTPTVMATPATPTVIYRESKREKKLRLPKFKGLDEPKLTVKAWLKAVKNELRRQATILRTEWREHEVFIEMVASFEGEVLLWYDTVEDSFESRQDQTFANLSNLLKDRYMVKRSNPEVVARLRLRKQQRGEPLVEYAQKLREIASSNPVDEEWLVDAFLSGMSNAWSATLIRGHKPATLNAAVNAALDQVGEYGEGYGVGLGAAMVQQDQRMAAAGHTPAAAPSIGGMQFSGVGGMQFAGGGNLGSVLTGYEGTGLAGGAPPRYDTEGRLVVTRGNNPSGQWSSPVIPMGYDLVPVNPVQGTRGAGTGANYRNSGSGSATHAGHNQRTDGQGGGKTAKRPDKTMKMEARGSGQQQPPQRGGGQGYSEPLTTKEARLANLRRWESNRRKTTVSYSKEGDMCYYCHKLGHHSHECELKRADLEDDSPVVDQNGDDNGSNASGAGNARRA